jgi:hypothetical protein
MTEIGDTLSMYTSNYLIVGSEVNWRVETRPLSLLAGYQDETIAAWMPWF